MKQSVLRFAAICVLGGTSWSEPAPGAAPAADAALEALILELGADTYAGREAAKEKLSAAGPAALPALERARPGDPEIQARIQELLDEARCLPAPEAAAGSPTTVPAAARPPSASCSIRGRALDATGTPAPGAYLEARLRDASIPERERTFFATAGPDGTFVFLGLREGAVYDILATFGGSGIGGLKDNQKIGVTVRAPKGNVDLFCVDARVNVELAPPKGWTGTDLLRDMGIRQIRLAWKALENGEYVHKGSMGIGITSPRESFHACPGEAFTVVVAGDKVKRTESEVIVPRTGEVMKVIISLEEK